MRQPLQRHAEGRILLRAGELQQLVAGQHQLADQGHQVFQHVDADPDGLAGDRRLGRRRLGRFGRRLGRGGDGRPARRPRGAGAAGAGAAAAGAGLGAARPGRARRPGGAAAGRTRRPGGGGGAPALGDGVQRRDQRGVVAGGLGAGGGQPGHDLLDPVDARTAPC